MKKTIKILCFTISILCLHLQKLKACEDSTHVRLTLYETHKKILEEQFANNQFILDDIKLFENNLNKEIPQFIELKNPDNLKLSFDDNSHNDNVSETILLNKQSFSKNGSIMIERKNNVELIFFGKSYTVNCIVSSEKFVLSDKSENKWLIDNTRYIFYDTKNNKQILDIYFTQYNLNFIGNQKIYISCADKLQTELNTKITRTAKANKLVLENRILNIYPNPATNLININASFVNKVENPVIKIYNTFGSLVKVINIKNTYENESTTIPISTEELSAGNYVLKLSINSNILISKFTINK